MNICIAVNREKLANIPLSYSFTNAIFREIRKQFSTKKLSQMLLDSKYNFDEFRQQQRYIQKKTELEPYFEVLTIKPLR